MAATENTVMAVVLNPTKITDADRFRDDVNRRAATTAHEDVRWYETTEDDPGAGQTRRAIDDGATVVVAAGGDGTVSACAGVLAQTGVCLAVVPAGTGNLLARNLQIPLARDEALDVAFASHTRRVDVLEAESRRAVVMVSLGFSAAMIRDSDDGHKSSVGWLTYVGGAVKAIRKTPRMRFTITVDDQAPRRRAAVGVLMANVGELTGGMTLLADAQPDDGLLDLVVLSPRRRVRDWAALLADAIRGRIPDNRTVATSTGRSVTIEAPRPVPVEFDGEHTGSATQVRVRVLPSALSVRCPAH
jgi:diacylglycerol kinase family enzyme